MLGKPARSRAQAAAWRAAGADAIGVSSLGALSAGHSPLWRLRPVRLPWALSPSPADSPQCQLQASSDRGSRRWPA